MKSESDHHHDGRSKMSPGGDVERSSKQSVQSKQRTSKSNEHELKQINVDIIGSPNVEEEKPPIRLSIPKKLFRILQRLISIAPNIYDLYIDYAFYASLNSDEEADIVNDKYLSCLNSITIG
ncbi:unnamed protein product [Rotaria magnacalcarata]|uniref:Uncharacterized protein n=2 Tax=Rotaria magnacalcarata TaxID=392030 RepID=A0A814JJ91_9BILA|nr:unnamed protein product [Rotaria magnacalcarata]CAF4092288.1 unnamed protein product [Rotaria magnacalcarata]CAF5104798.1 unnamed protein product [Rotaria magnacalcarata]